MGSISDQIEFQKNAKELNKLYQSGQLTKEEYRTRLGDAIAKSSPNAAKQVYEQRGTQAIEELVTPTATGYDQRWRPEEYKYENVLDTLSWAPETGTQSPWEQVALQEQSKAAQANLQPTREIYQDFRDIYAQGGLTAIDRAKYEAAKQQNLAVAKQQRDATLANMQARGMGGSGAELAAVLAGQQAANQNISQESLAMNAAALERANQALYGAGTMAGQLYEQEYQTGTAADLVNQFNTQGLRNAETARANYIRSATSADVAGRNAVNTANTEQRNEMAKYYNAEEPWRVYGAQFDKAALQAGQYTNLANMYAQQAAADKASRSQMIGNVLQAGAILGSAALGPAGVAATTAATTAARSGTR